MTGRRTTTTGAGSSTITGGAVRYRTWEPLPHNLEFRYEGLPADRRPRPARQELVHLLQPRLLYACKLFPWLSPCERPRPEAAANLLNGAVCYTCGGYRYLIFAAVIAHN